MNPAWVPAITREAHRLGMTVTGHIPAFTNADAMIAAGYDEVTHVNQLMLGWVLDPKEDTRTPLRLTAMKRTATLDLALPRVQRTIDRMAAGHIAHDPTAVTLELLMGGRDGTPNPAVADYIDHLPIGLQRRRRQAIAPIASPADAAAYDGAMAKVKQVLKLLHDRGIRLLPGTDDQTGLSVHRELQIYAEAGIPVPEVLRLATLTPEQYIGRDQQLGSIARGKLADFILLPGDPTRDLRELHRIAMVVKDGTLYFPSEIYPAFGVKPFAAAPKLTLPKAMPKAAGAGPAHDAMDEF
jgi:imidazolonepropionase-like amidohydrolase